MQNSAVRVNLKDETLYPCDSGKTFSHCCKSKNHIYESLTIDKSGKRVIYDQTEIISGIDNVLKFIQDRINNLETVLTREEALRKLKKLYQLLNKALTPMQRVTSCKAGCDHCCHLLIYTSPIEIELMKDYMKENFSKEMMKSFDSNLSKHALILSNIKTQGEGKFSEESKKIYYKSKVPCAFLDETSCCLIYEARPYICRKYLVYNDPKICSDPSNITNQYYGGYLTTVKEAIYKLNTLVYGGAVEGKHILSWFVE